MEIQNITDVFKNTEFTVFKNVIENNGIINCLVVKGEAENYSRKALDQLPKLKGCQVHCTVMLSEVDHKMFKKLGIGLTCDPVKKIE